MIFGVDGAVSVLLNENNSNFVDGEWVSAPGIGNCAAGGDFNGDGKPDLADPTGSGLVILLGTGNASAPYKTGTTITFLEIDSISAATYTRLTPKSLRAAADPAPATARRPA
jgi:hypothetical protein